MHRKQETWFLAHVTNHQFLHIIIIHIIFLFHTASANLRAYFLLKLWAYAFYITGWLFQVLKVSFYNLFASYSH